MEAIVDIGGSDIINKELSCSTAGFSKLIAQLETMGYQSGLTFQAIPYDWRKSLVSGETQNTIPKSIKSLYRNTG